MKTAFEKAYAGLNERQKEAVDAVDGPVMVVAGPGTGKTQVLTLRIANILAKTDTAPRSILALTFTEKAAFTMSERLAQLIGSMAYGVRISTFHAFCNEIIGRSPDSFPHIIGGTPIGDSEQLALIEQLVDSPRIKLLRPAGRPEAYVKGIISTIGTIKGKGYDPKRFSALAEPGRMAELADIYTRYERELARRNRYDYADMLVQVCRALEKDKDLRLDLAEQYQYLLVDEHQDTNRLQNRVVQLIAGDDMPNLFVVGDLEQAIYRFQGASPENFRDFSKRYPSCRVIRLQKNYRSSQIILDAAAGISPTQGTLKATEPRKAHPIECAIFSSPGAMEYGIAHMAAKAIKEGTPAGQIAVLYRKNSEAETLAAAFERLGVPHAVQSDQDVLGDRAISKLLTIARAARHIGQDAHLLEALQVDTLGVSPLDAAKIGQAARKDRVSSWDIIRNRKLPVFSLLEDLARTIANESAPKALQMVVERTGWATQAMALANGHQTIAKLQTLFDSVRAHTAGNKRATLADFLDSLDRLERHGTDLAAVSTGRQDAVQLMTAHKAKGLEFDLVFIANAARGHWDDARKPAGLPLPTELTDDSEDDEDIRRLMYVAATRARQKLVLAWPQHSEDGKDLQPSRFVLAIPAKLTTKLDTASLEKEYATHLTTKPGASARPMLQQKEYIAELMDKQPLSVTALNNFLTCPWRYYFINLVRIPEAPTPKTEYGTAAHQALRIFFDRRTKRERAMKNDLLARFRTAIARAPLQDHVIEQLTEEGTDALAGWHDAWHASWHSGVRTEVPIERVQLADGTWLTGKIDKIELLPNGRVSVVDYKTKSPMSANQIRGLTKSATGNEYRQLLFYKLLLDRDKRWHMESGQIDFLEPNASGNYKKETFPITTAMTVDLEKTIMKTSKAIRTLSFWNDRCGDRKCRYCLLRDLMQ